MSGDTAATGTFKLNIPADLVNELKRNPVPRKSSMKVEGFKPSLLDRLFGGDGDVDANRG
jgi:hypothetical protein